MQLQEASRKQAKIKMAIQGPSGGGKTMSALLIAYGLCGLWERIAVIDTENHSADLYAHLGKYKVLSISAPFAPEKYIDALNLCVSSGIEVVIIDSMSHEWDGSGGILETHSRMTGNSYTNWAVVTPRHNAFVQAMLQSPVHIIGTIRSKQDYVLSERNGKMVPEKVGLKGITREGLDYEFTLVLDINIRHYATASKDRTGLYIDKPEFMPSSAIGIKIRDWCNAGIPNIEDRINRCASMEELVALYAVSLEYHNSHAALFSSRKHALQPQNNNQVHHQTSSANGVQQHS